MSMTLDFFFVPEIERAHASNDMVFVLDHLVALDKMARKAEVRTLSDMGVADDPEDGTPSDDAMVDPKEGIRTLDVILAELRQKPAKNPEKQYPDLLLEELQELIQSLQKAAKKKAKFRFMVV